MAYADEVFVKMCFDILENGYPSGEYEVRPKWEDGTSAHYIKQFCVVNTYNLSEEFPMLTLRPIFFRGAVDELLWIWQKKSNNIKDLNSHVWDAWADSHGSIGKAYGYQMSIKHKYPEGEFDQVDRVIYDLKHKPYSRRIITNMYNHSDLHSMNLYPCAYSLTFNVTEDRLNAILNQRSQDVLAANGWNVCQYSVLIHMFAQVCNLKVGKLVHVISDAHIYDRHVPIIRQLITREQYPAPVLKVNPDIKNFYEFRVDDFRLDDYQFGESVKNIPIAV